MARKLSKTRYSSKRAQPSPTKTVAALLARVEQFGAAITPASAGLGALAKQRAALENLLIELTAAAESMPRSARSLRPAEAKVGEWIGVLEERIARKPIRTLGAAIAKLEVYADCQGYDISTRRERRPARSFEERLFRSVVDDMRRIDQA